MPSEKPVNKARPVLLRSGLSLEAGFTRIARHCLRQIRANEDGLKFSSDPEFVHQIRVGLRRLRSALSLFKPWIPLPQPLAEELAWLGQALGAVRDAEVLAHTTLPALALACAGIEDLGALQEAAAGMAQRRRREAVLVLNSERYQRLLADLNHWLKRRGWRTASPLPEELGMPLAAAARRMLKLRRKVLNKKLSKKLSKNPLALPDRARSEDWHRLRIAVKKLRYAHGFFQSIADATGARAPSQLSTLQELLGQFNDAEVGRRLLLHVDPKQARSAACAGGALWAQSQQRIDMITAMLPAFLPDADSGPPKP